jgi:hypothetical protein
VIGKNTQPCDRAEFSFASSFKWLTPDDLSVIHIDTLEGWCPAINRHGFACQEKSFAVE